MHETCPIINKICPFCFIADGKEFCGLAHSKKHRTNMIAEMKQCPQEKIKAKDKE